MRANYHNDSTNLASRIDYLITEYAQSNAAQLAILHGHLLPSSWACVSHVRRRRGQRQWQRSTAWAGRAWGVIIIWQPVLSVPMRYRTVVVLVVAFALNRELPPGWGVSG